ncbi:MAG: Chemotaxis protein methyltransferase CheR [Myxococcaceae bacterium]|nr:Chemotaxis protein methyltransferase CheR [Myxococcaceae bacterium]
MVLVAVLTALKVALPPIGVQLPFLLYFIVVVFAAWYGDRWTGAFGTLLSALAANYFFLGSPLEASLTNVHLLQTGMFALEGATLIAIVGLVRTERGRTATASARVAGLQELTTGLAKARTPPEVAAVVVGQGVVALDARSGALGRVDDDDVLVRIAIADAAEAEIDTELDADLAEAFAAEQRVLSKRRIAMPLVIEGRKLGALAFRFRDDRTFDATDKGLLDTIAAQASQALDRAEGFAREVWLRQRLEILSAVATDLSGATTREQVAEVVVSRGAPAMGADTCTLYVLSDDERTLDLIGSRGVPQEVLDSIETIDASSLNPTWAAFESGASMWVESAEEYAEKIPSVSNIATDGPRAAAFWSMPLVVEGRRVGLLGMGYYKARRFTAEKRTFVETFTQHCAQAISRAQRLEGERYARLVAEEARASLEREEERRGIVADATSALAVSLDYKVTLGRLASILVPRLADWCAIEMIDEAGKSDQLAVAHGDPKMVEYAWELRRRYPPSPNGSNGVPNVLRTGTSEMYGDITDEMLVAGAIDEEHLRISRELKLRSALIVPLVARGATLGAITMVHAESGRRYGRADLVLAEEIARRAAISVDNARLFGAEQRARAAADDANRLKDEFLATVSHELRTPLNAILGWSRMITTGALDEARRARASETIERNAVAMTQLVEDLLDVSRIISGKMRLEIESVDLGKVVEAAIESIRPAALAKEITLRSIVEPAPGPLLGDPNRLQQVVWNLLSNAVKFTPRHGRVEVIVRRSGSSVEVSVRDDGAGIDAAFAPYVFDRFRQADGKITRTHGGLGLGLAITRQLVEMHGGSVEAQSEGIGHGATFTVKLPITAMRPLADPKPAVTADGGEPDVGSELEGLHVLAVDDDEDSRRLVHAVLEKAGARVTLATSVEEAMTAFDRELPDVVVSDIGMPGQDGLELIRRIRALPSDRGGQVPAAALTAYARAGDRTRVLSAGFSMHLPKPIEPEELVAVVVSLARFARG